MVQPGTYDKVNVGLTYLRTQAGEVEIRPNQVGYAASAQDAPRLLPAIPEFFNRAVEPRSAQRGGPAGGGELQLAATQSVAPAQQVTRAVLTTSGFNLTSGSSSSSGGTGGSPSTTTGNTTTGTTTRKTTGTTTGTATGTATTGTTTGTSTTGTSLTGLSGTVVGYTTPQGSSGGNGLSGVN